MTANPRPLQRDARAFPLMERPVVAVVLAVAAGLLNAWTLARTQSFATVQSGNIVSAGIYIAQGNGAALARVTISIAAFAVGAFVCAILVNLADRARKSYSPWILGGEALILAALAVAFLLGAEAMAVAAGISFVAGVQGNAFHRDRGMLYGNVAVTFVLQAAFASLGRAASRRVYDDGEHHLRTAAVYGAVIVGFCGGGAAGFWLDSQFSTASIIGSACILAVLAIITGASRVDADPAQSAPTA